MKLPPYPGTSQCVKIGNAGSARSDPSQIRLNYNLAEKDGGLLEEHVDPDPMKQFGKWFQVGLCPRGAPGAHLRSSQNTESVRSRGGNFDRTACPFNTYSWVPHCWR